MTEDEQQALLRRMQDTSDPLNAARQEFSYAAARLEQACRQKRPLDIFGQRQFEFEAAKKIITAFLRKIPGPMDVADLLSLLDSK